MGTRIKNQISDFVEDWEKDPNAEPLRLGRRESEPHSAEVSYIYEVLSENHPNSRTFWDLHHYFKLEGTEIDLQFDISYFSNFSEPFSVSSFRASDYNNRIPDMVINVLSVGTWRKDFMETMENCSFLKIPLYIVFTPYNVTSAQYKAPFLRAYELNDDELYDIKTAREVCTKQGENNINLENIISLSPKIPLSIGLELLKEKHKSGSERYRVIFIDEKSNKRLLTKAEKEKERAEKYLDLLKKNNIAF